MTYKEFLAVLRRTRGTWELRPSRMDSRRMIIRQAIGGVCPIEGVVREGIDTLDAKLEKNIMYAADDFGERETRRDLLRACGLKERKA